MWDHQHKLVVGTTIVVFLLSFFLSYCQIDLPLPQFLSLRRKSDAQENRRAERPAESERKSNEKSAKSGGKSAEDFQQRAELPAKVFGVRELSQYDGSPKSKGLYLALLGRVYNVSKGQKHYGPGGGYHFFAGRDATRAFVSGDFTEKGLTDDVTGLTPTELLGIEEWIRFYEKDYETVGVLQGSYYDSRGKATSKLKSVMKLMEEAHKWQASEKAETEVFPPCNSEWSSGKGGRVWCTNKSGGISRDWAGVPRKLFKPGSSAARCACVKNFGPPSDNSPDRNQGDLDHPALQEYPGCNAQAVSCLLRDN